MGGYCWKCGYWKPTVYGADALCHSCKLLRSSGNTNTGRDYGDETRPAPPDYPECERVKQQPHLAMEMDAIARRIVREALGG
jgi:hypothetical protein